MDLDYQAESEKLASHVVSVLEGEKSPIEEKGFWFGINNPVLNNGETSAGIYFCLSPDFDPKDEDDGDWACNATFYPEAGAFKSEVMKSIYRIAYNETKLGNKAEFALCLAYGLKLAQESMNKFHEKYPDKKIGYAVGFDSGDFINMGWL